MMQGLFKDFVHTTMPPQRTDVERSEPTLPIKQRLYEAQDGNCNGCGHEYLIKDFEIDHVDAKVKREVAIITKIISYYAPIATAPKATSQWNIYLPKLQKLKKQGR